MEEPSFRFILGKPLKGWLKKQGGVMRSWQRKWFVLKDKFLFCLNREDDTKTQNTYMLSDYDLKDVPNNLDEPEKFMFELIAVNGSDTVTLCAASEQEKAEWMKGLRYNIYADRGGAIFGLPLQEAMKYEHKHGRALIRIVEDCIKFLDANAMEAEGIFRLAGRTGLMKELRSQYEMGLQPSLESVDVHTVASLFKSYLRELPESLIPPSFYQRAMNYALRYADNHSEKEKEVSGLAELLQELPGANYAALSYICRFLSRLAANSGITRMDAKNLALLFGPNLIRHMDNTPEMLMVTADLSQHLAYMLIHHCDTVLPFVPSKETAQAAEGCPNSAVIRRKDFPATGDLLRMSQPVDCGDASLLRPRPAFRDLEGLNFRTVSVTDDVFRSSQSPEAPSSPMTFVPDHFCSAADGTAGGASASSSSDAVLETDECGSPGPVAPRRNRTLKKRRPPSFPASPDGNRQLDCQDILKALADVSSSGGDEQNAAQPTITSTTTDNNNSHDKDTTTAADSDSKHNHGPPEKDKPSQSQFFLSANSKSSSSSVSSLTHFSSMRVRTSNHSHRPEAFASDSDKLGKSAMVMEMQIAGLKTELMNSKVKWEGQCNALKNKMDEIKDRYEQRITSLEKQHKSQMLDLRAKLESEKTAREEAVERTVALQAQLYKYRLHYGELKDA